MEKLWAAFERTLWKQRQIEDKEHERKCAQKVAEKAPWCCCKTTQEEFHEWEDYAAAYYTAPSARSGGVADALFGEEASPVTPKRARQTSLGYPDRSSTQGY